MPRRRHRLSNFAANNGFQMSHERGDIITEFCNISPNSEMPQRDFAASIMPSNIFIRRISPIICVRYALPLSSSHISLRLYFQICAFSHTATFLHFLSLFLDSFQCDISPQNALILSQFLRVIIPHLKIITGNNLFFYLIDARPQI